MKNLWQQLLKDETGVIVSSELALVGTVGVLGMVVGLESVATAVTQELTDLSNAYRSLNQSYSYRSISKGQHARFSGSGFTNLGGGSALGTADVNGQQSFSANSQTVFENSTNSANSIQVLRGQAIEEVIEEVPVTIQSVESVCPDDEIIEEHVIRRRVKANSAGTLDADCARSSQNNRGRVKANSAGSLDADCARSSQNNGAKIRSAPENNVNSIPNSQLPADKVETKKPKK